MNTIADMIANANPTNPTNANFDGHRSTNATFSSTLAALLRAAQSARAFVRKAFRDLVQRTTSLFSPARSASVPASSSSSSASSSSSYATVVVAEPTNEAAASVNVDVGMPIPTDATPSAAAVRLLRDLHNGPRRVSVSAFDAMIRSVVSPAPPSSSSISTAVSDSATDSSSSTNTTSTLTSTAPIPQAVAEPTELPALIDVLLVPSSVMPETPAQRAHRQRHLSRNTWMQQFMATQRMRTAAQHRRVMPQPQDPMTYDCGCGWCPNGEAAYPLCAAVTIRRTMHSVPRDRASSSPASVMAQRYGTCARHHAYLTGYVRS